jgi:uncharacterized protein (DUF2141 family)
MGITSLYCDTIQSIITINGVSVNGGKVYVAVYDNSTAYKKDDPCAKEIFEPIDTTLVWNINLAEGEYVVSIFQDTNNDGRLNTIIFGIPKEPFGITNYSHGIPAGFDKLKMSINSNSNMMVVNIGKYRA